MRRIVPVAAALILLGACHRHTDDDTSLEVNTAEAPDIAVKPEPTAEPTPAPPPPAANLSDNASAAVAPPPDEPMAVDKQVEEDAAATGMTAHSSGQDETGATPSTTGGGDNED